MRSLFSPIRRLGLLLFLVPALMMCGCGRKTGTISGKVTYKGKPLKGGMVTFLSEGPKSMNKPSKIEKDGSYSISGFSVGPAKITVQGVKARRLMVPKSMQNMPGVAGAKSDQEEVYVPDKYASPDTSDLTYEVQAGKQEHNIDLK